MLSAQRREFDDKKKDETPYPRNFERWYALDYFRRPRALTSTRFYVTLLTTVVAYILCKATMVVPSVHHVHQAAAVSKAHAMLSQDCASCHDKPFQPALRLFAAHMGPSVSNQRCNHCHVGAIHHAKQSHEPDCASCHREHQGHEVLASHVSDRHCTSCHGDLANHLQPGEKAPFHATITQFNRDHPEFAPSAKGKQDQAKILFNHAAHLDLDLGELKVLGAKGHKLACVDCHQMDDERKYLKPINYEKHCAQCHVLNVALVGDFAPPLKPAVAAFSRRPLPHREPGVVRAVLRDRLVEFAQVHGVVANKGVPSVPRPLPWRPVTDEQWSWAQGQAKQTENLLFMNRQWQKNEALTGCTHCHIEKDRAAGLPVYHKTEIPARWYTHSIFNHGSHRTMDCGACHDRNIAEVKVVDSKTTADILLPTAKVCQECHTGKKGGARNACVECHRYHER